MQTQTATTETATVTKKQQAAIDAYTAFFMEDGAWAPVEKALAAAGEEQTVIKFDKPESGVWRLDTIVRDAYWDLRKIGIDDFTAYGAVIDF